jgi:hypothetical protein
METMILHIQALLEVIRTKESRNLLVLVPTPTFLPLVLHPLHRHQLPGNLNP